MQRTTVIPYRHFSTTNRSRLESWRWNRQVVPKRRWGITVLHCV